jgi:biotin carboxylase
VATCKNKNQTFDTLQAMEAPGIFTIPELLVKRDNLKDLHHNHEYIEPTLADLRVHLGLAADAPLVLKPAYDGGSTGVMRIDAALHLQTYVDAVFGNLSEIPAHLVPGALLMLALPPACVRLPLECASRSSATMCNV